MTANRTYRIAIVGASSLAGKELSDALSESSFAASSFTLLDEDRVNGQIAAAGDEISFIQKIEASSFEGMDLVFFAGDPDVARRFWQSAREAGAAIIDLTSGLEGNEEALIRSPVDCGGEVKGRRRRGGGVEPGDVGGGLGASCGGDAWTGCREAGGEVSGEECRCHGAGTGLAVWGAWRWMNCISRR